MFTKIEDFLGYWKSLSAGTEKILGALTDQSLGQAVADGHRTIGRIAWHIAATIPEMGGRTGIDIKGPAMDAPVPKTAKEIKEGYSTAANSLLELVEKDWTDETLQIEDDMYGESWKRGLTLLALGEHEIHHRGQLTVLMRQAGLQVPGVFGPSKEEWANYGAPPPEI
jgi:uncharacterized damage-inducible protein DinB